MLFVTAWIFVLVACFGCGSNQQHAVVTGASMFPAYVGEHYEIECQDCQIPFMIDAIDVPESGNAVCPNCGFQQNKFRDLKKTESTDYELSPISGSIKRWDVVAFHGDGTIAELPGQKLAVKRVVGLPGEEIRIEGGNVLANNKRLIKPRAIQEQMRVHVYDSKFQPANTGIVRWKTEGDNSRWKKSADGGWRFESSPEQQQAEWITYQHVRGYRYNGNSNSNEFVPIEDSYGYNQNYPRTLNLVNEVVLRIDITCSKDSRITIRATGGEQDCDLGFDFERKQLTIKAGAATSRVGWHQVILPPITSITVSNVDGLIQVFANDAQVASLGIPESGEHDKGEPLQLKIGGNSGDIHLGRIRIWRDIFYLSKLRTVNDENETWRLANDQYFVLGDNSPVSIDSRRYGPVSADSIIGTLAPGR